MAIYPLQKKTFSSKTTTFAVGSGKGGVGKTLTALHWAAVSSQLGRKVLLVDGDLGLANVDILLGLKVSLTLNDVIHGKVNFLETKIPGPLGMDILPCASGISRLQDLHQEERKSLIRALKEAFSFYDVVIIDTSAGLAPHVLILHEICQNSIIVTTPEPHALADAYSFIKVLSQKGRSQGFLTVNMTKTSEQGPEIFQRLDSVLNRFTKFSLKFLGSIPYDLQLKKAIMSRKLKLQSSFLSGQAWYQTFHTWENTQGGHL